MTLPRLFGLPWETGPNGRDGAVLAPLGLTPFVAVGSPLTKTPGAPISVTWGARNSGEQTGYARLRVLVGSTVLGQQGPVGVPAGSQVTLNASATAPSTPGALVGVIALEQTDAAGSYMGAVATDTFDLTVSAPPPSPAVLQAVGQPTIS